VVTVAKSDVPQPPRPSRGAWQALRIPAFRSLLLAGLVSDIGTFVQTVGAAWLMLSLTGRPTYVALIQTASTLPFFLFALPAGAMADVVNRRKLILAAEFWMVLCATALALLAVLELLTPWVLLGLTFALALGVAVEVPAWQASMPDLVPAQDLHSALALDGAEFNVASAVGPGLGGIVVAMAGAGAAFILNAFSFFGVILVILGWKGPARKPSNLPPEHVLAGITAGFRYARYAPALRGVLFRSGLFVFFASSFWALLPIIARDLKGGSATYGFLLAAFGAGAVAGPPLLHALRQDRPTEPLAIGATLAFAGVCAVMGHPQGLLVLFLALAAGGAAWVTLMSALNTAAQTSVPQWVRARALSIYLLVFQGSMAAGSAIWGGIAARTSVRVALTIAAVGLIATVEARIHFPLPRGPVDVTPWIHWAAPKLFIEPSPEEGPVMVTVEYRVDPQRSREFLAAMKRLEVVRRRDGAINWGLFYDPATPTRYLETFMVDSWAEHMRQHERQTAADREIARQVRSVAEEEPAVSHLVFARPNTRRRA
jgi:MFS family permease